MNAQAAAAPTARRSAALDAFEGQWRARAADALAPLRTDAMRRFLTLGLPTARDDSWRYTNLRGLAAQAFTAAAEGDTAGNSAAASLAAAGSVLADGGRVPAIVDLNGYPQLGRDAAVRIEGMEIRSLRALAREDAALVARLLGPVSDAEQQRWSLLNTALFGDGLYVKITGAAAAPLLLVHAAAAAGAGQVSHPRTIIEVAPGASATIIEQHVTQGGEAGLCNSVTQIALGAGARLEHYRVFAAHADATNLDTLDIRQGRDSRLRQFTVALGGGLVRAQLEARLEEPGADFDGHALLVGHGTRHVDCVATAVHAARDTCSRQTARALASGTSRAIFNSKVIVQAGAVRSESQQSCRGLLLSPTAEIDTRPQLEIHTDEVKCAHGATTGRLDPDMFFYLLSRGLDRATAQSLLVFAFLDDVLTGMSLPAARTAIENELIEQLPDSKLLGAFR